jgi:hypothetical protein
MAAKSLVNELTETVPEPDDEPDPVVVVELELLLPQAAARSPTTRTIVAIARLLLSLTMISPNQSLCMTRSPQPGMPSPKRRYNTMNIL